VLTNTRTAYKLSRSTVPQSTAIPHSYASKSTLRLRLGLGLGVGLTIAGILLATFFFVLRSRRRRLVAQAVQHTVNFNTKLDANGRPMHHQRRDRPAQSVHATVPAVRRALPHPPNATAERDGDEDEKNALSLSGRAADGDRRSAGTFNISGSPEPLLQVMNERGLMGPPEPYIVYEPLTRQC
jgi:hypothetical protein